MIIFLLSISCVQGFFKFITPDELKNLTVYEEIAAFSKVQFLPNYGKLVFAYADNCEIKGRYNETDIITVFEKDLEYKCNIRDLAISAKDAGSGAFVLVLSFNEIYYYYYDYYINYEGEELVYSYEGNEPIDIPCLLVYGDIESVLEDYKLNSTVWVNYGYKTIPQENSPKIKYFMASDYSIDSIFFNDLYDFLNYEDLYLYNFELVFLFDDWLYDYENENCVSTNSTLSYNISFCLYSNYYATGYQRIMSTVIILNYYYSLPSFDYLYYFLSFLSEVNYYCYNDYSEQCVSDLVTYYGGIPNTDAYILTLHHSEFGLTIPCYSINEIFIYTQKCLFEALKVGKYYSQCKNYLDECNDGCMYYELQDLICNPKCNSTACGYDNLLCLQENDCFIFTYGDGYCSESCLTDPDCKIESLEDDLSSDDYPYLLLKIIIPIIGGVLIILIVVFVVYLIYSRKKIKDLKAKDGSTIELDEEIKSITFTKKVSYNEKPFCVLDLKPIEVGDKVGVAPKCKHIFHYDCLKLKQKEMSLQGCPLCNQVKEVETNRV
ncbi:hypothetical protein SteCoe_5054 [Stentor coeruleus]|uniref:RING-type domain-containing protein n=1 Tax=Stentor coeruleus TaxID=5963 RepID=A0A1R2CT67_9CILI|nr:hypothetical protein SteCoe_5054 [Stentor coeruleus]